jgi:hypothetical protein
MTTEEGTMADAAKTEEPQLRKVSTKNRPFDTIEVTESQYQELLDGNMLAGKDDK